MQVPVFVGLEYEMNTVTIMCRYYLAELLLLWSCLVNDQLFSIPYRLDRVCVCTM